MKIKTMKNWRRAAYVLAAVAAGTAFPMQALAASPEFARTEEEWAALRDDVLEYGEIEDLIHEYNATVQNNAYKYRKFLEDYGHTKEEVSDAYRDLAADLYSSMSGESEAGAMVSDLQLEMQAKSMLEQANNNLEDSRIYLLSYEQMEKDLAASAQASMISYYRRQLELADMQETFKMAQQEYELAKAKQNAGTATSLEVLTARESVETAQKNISGLEAEIKQNRESLLVALGWNHNDNPVILQLPELDLTRIDEMNPDEDLAQALENNYTLRINKRKLENAVSQTTRESLTTSIQNNEKQIAASLSSAYQKVLSARLSYEQAQTSAAVEEENTRAAGAKLQAGIITSIQYEQQENTLSAGMRGVESAELDLLEAMETYNWSVKGLAAAE